MIDVVITYQDSIVPFTPAFIDVFPIVLHHLSIQIITPELYSSHQPLPTGSLGVINHTGWAPPSYKLVYKPHYHPSTILILTINHRIQPHNFSATELAILGAPSCTSPKNSVFFLW